MAENLASCIREVGLEEHREYLLGRARPSIEIITADVPTTNGRSKLGGAPDVPPDFEWPHHELGPYRFIAQFDLAEMPDGQDRFPRAGLVSFFYAHDEDGESFWGAPDYVRVYRFDDVDALRAMEGPAAVRLGSTSRVRLERGADVPPWPQDEAAAKSWPIGKDRRAAYWELRKRIHPSGRYLLGYPFNPTLGYDPTPGPEWCSLLTLESDEALQWCWHDDDWLVTFVEEARLRAGDFSSVKSDAG